MKNFSFYNKNKNNINIVDITSVKDIEQCVDMYLPHNTWLDTDRTTCIKNLSIAWKSNKFVKIKRNKKGDILAFLYADVIHQAYSKNPVLYQMFCCSIGNIAGARALLDLHKSLIEYGESIKIGLVISGGSHFDENHSFTKFLEKHGWERRGYLAAYKTKWYK